MQIPTNIRALKAQDMPLALAWRQHTRQLFTDLFAQNYTVTDFILQENSAYYFLIHNFLLRGIATVEMTTEEIMKLTRSDK